MAMTEELEMSMIVKIMRADEWRSFGDTGELIGGVHDTENFIHFSTIEQLPRTANKWFEGEDGLMAVVVDTAKLGPELRWEPNAAGELFPHLYGHLSQDAVVEAVPFPRRSDGVFELPEALGTYGG
jgi:uncharacterized protein (DUF952 family)